MRDRLSHTPLNDPQEGVTDADLKIPVMTLSTLVSMVAIAKWVACDHDAMTNPGFRRAVQFMEQLVYEQSHEQGGDDEVWKDPQDGSYHHPSFPEQHGDAWEAIEQYNEEIFKMKLIEYASELSAERDMMHEDEKAERRDHYEHILQDVAEQWGCKELVRALMT